jgi:hypothetical protein
MMRRFSCRIRIEASSGNVTTRSATHAQGDRNMTRCISLALLVTILGCGSVAVAQTQGKVCRMEQQCHWENFKKVCTYVRVCR